jgi:general stress protein 26
MMASKTVQFTRRDAGNDAAEWERVLKMMEGTQVVHLATAGEEGPRVRPVTTVDHDGALYVLTGARDAKVAQLRRDPRFEIAREWERGGRVGYVRLRGRATFVRARAEREAVASAAGFAGRYWTGVDDPLMAVVRLDVTAAETLPPGSREYVLLGRPARPRHTSATGRDPG